MASLSCFVHCCSDLHWSGHARASFRSPLRSTACTWWTRWKARRWWCTAWLGTTTSGTWSCHRGARTTLASALTCGSPRATNAAYGVRTGKSILGPTMLWTITSMHGATAGTVSGRRLRKGFICTIHSERDGILSTGGNRFDGCGQRSSRPLNSEKFTKCYGNFIDVSLWILSGRLKTH